LPQAQRPVNLDKLDLSKKLTRRQYDEQVAKEQLRMRDFGLAIYRCRVPVLCVIEGWDAAGKGGAIKRITYTLDPRGFTVASFASPRGEEKTHQYLWRFWRNLPRAGHLMVFDRSYYGRVLVERVEKFATRDEWSRAYQEINEFESHQTSCGMVIVKFWLHISRREQLRRFKGRETDPFRLYKLTDEDWRNRERWEDYQDAVEEMFLRTSTPHAPWTVVESEDKFYARVKILRTLADAIERRLE
jgi:polyphosphate kinase 2 (PPK2 family)